MGREGVAYLTSDSHINEVALSREPPEIVSSGNRASLRCPFPSEKKLLDPIRVKEIVQGDVPKHDEHRIVAVLPMLGRSCPDVWWKCPKPGDERLTVFDVSPQ